MFTTKGLFADFSGFVGKKIEISERSTDKKYNKVIKGTVYGAFLDEHSYESGLTITKLHLFIGEIASEKDLHYGNDKILYKANPGAVIHYTIQWGNGDMDEVFSRDNPKVRIVLVM